MLFYSAVESSWKIFDFLELNLFEEYTIHDKQIEKNFV